MSKRGSSDLYKLRVNDLLSTFGDQPLSFWFISLYLFFEYVRPQSIYPAVEGWPFAQAALVLAGGALAVEGKFTRSLNTADSALILFFVALLASVALAFDPGYASSSIKVFLTWVLVYYLITTLVDTEERFLLFMFFFLLWSLKMAQHATRSWANVGFGFRSWGATGGPGWFHNSGEFAIQMTIFVPLAIYFILALKKYWPTWKVALMCLLPTSGFIGVLASASRGGQVGMAAVVVVMVAKSRRRVRALIALAVLVAGAWLLMPEAQKQRFEQAGEDQTSEARLAYWEDGIEMMNEHPVLGIGYDNWIPYYEEYYGGGEGEADWLRNQLPHNIFIEAGSELGYTGLLAFLLLIGATLYLNHRTRRLAPRCRGDSDFYRYMAHGLDAALAGYLVSGFFVTVLYYPYFWINLAMTSALYTVAVKRAQTGPEGTDRPRRVRLGASRRGGRARPIET